MAAAVNVTLLGTFYERFAGRAVEGVGYYPKWQSPTTPDPHKPPPPPVGRQACSTRALLRGKWHCGPSRYVSAAVSSPARPAPVRERFHLPFTFS